MRRRFGFHTTPTLPVTLNNTPPIPGDVSTKPRPLPVTLQHYPTRFS